MNRRKLLSLCGTGGLASLAGCQAFGSTLREEPASFEDVTLSGPSDAAVGESVSLSVSVTNAGGQAGDFADALTVEGGDSLSTEDTAVRIGDVPASESRTVEVGPFALGHAGDHRFGLADAGASHVVTAAAPTLRAGESLALPDGPTVVVSDASAHASLFYEAPNPDQDAGNDDAANGRGVLSPSDGSVLVAVRASVENRGREATRVGPASFEVADGRILASLTPGGDAESLEAIAGVDGDPFADGPIAPGESRSGWLLAEVPRASVTAGLRVAWNRAHAGTEGGDASTTTTGGDSTVTARGDSATTTGGNSTATTPSAADSRPDTDSRPEVRWTFAPAESPQFEAADLTILEAVELGSSVTASATVRNAGSVTATYRGVLERRDADAADDESATDDQSATDEGSAVGSGWEPVATFERALDPDEETTVRTHVRASSVGRTEYRLRPGAASASVTVRPAERALGGQFTTPGGAAIRAEVGTDTFDGTLASYIYEDLNTQTVRARSGQTFAFVRVAVENDADEAIPVPERTAFSLVADGTAYSVFHSSSSRDVTFRSPVDGPWYAPRSEMDPGGRYAGWLVFQVPAGTPVGELSVRYSPSDDVTATWSG